MSLATLHPPTPSPLPSPPDHPSRASAAAPTVAIAAEALADIVGGLAGAPPLWSGFLDDVGAERPSVQLLATEAYDVWLLGWPPGSRVEPHDHGDSIAAFVVVQGELTELRWSPDRTERTVGVGEIVAVAEGVVHDVLASEIEGAAPAISIHAYSPPLRTMGYYADDGARLIARVDVDAEPAVPTDAHPQPRGDHPAGDRGRPRLGVSTVLRTALLLLLAEREGHGYELARRLAELGVVVDTTSIYRTLRAMARAGELRATWNSPSRGPARKVYALTVPGLAHLRQAADGAGSHRPTVDRLLDRCALLQA